MTSANGYHNMDNDFEEIRIEVPWGHIAGQWWGPKDIQPILAMHGWQDNAGTFDTLAPLLISPDISILSIDLPGHGFSSHYPKGQYYYIFWDGIVCVRRIVKHFKWKKVTLMGHSLGGAIAFLYSAIYPNEVEKYVALDIPAPVRRSSTIDAGECIDKFLKYETLRANQNPTWNYHEMINIVENAYKNNLTRNSCKILMRRGMKPLEEDSSLYAFCRDVRLKSIGVGLFSTEEIYELATKITCKVLNIRAESGFFAKDDDYYDTVIDKIKQNAALLEYHTVPGTHHVHLNNPVQMANIIAKFLKL